MQGEGDLNLDDAVAVLQKHGLRITPQRRQIIQVLLEADRPLTAGEISRLVRRAYPQISLDTVYRNLTLLAQVGLVNQINLQNRESSRFEFQGNDEHHHHVVCLICGTAYCIDVCPLPVTGVHLPDDPEFQVVAHAFEIYGYCKECR